MIAAIYARKSAEQTGTAEEAKSVTRQIDHARAYAAAPGALVGQGPARGGSRALHRAIGVVRQGLAK